MFGTPEVLVAAKDLCSWPGISIEEPAGPIEYFHILLDRHDILTAEGAPAESLFLGEEALHTMSPEGLRELAEIFSEHSDLGSKGFGTAARTILKAYEATALA